MPVLHGNIANTVPILHGIPGHYAQSHLSGNQIQGGTGRIDGADDMLFAYVAAGPLLEGFFHIVIKNDLGVFRKLRRHDRPQIH